jgi:hypothetical protein
LLLPGTKLVTFEQYRRKLANESLKVMKLPKLSIVEAPFDEGVDNLDSFPEI